MGQKGLKVSLDLVPRASSKNDEVTKILEIVAQQIKNGDGNVRYAHPNWTVFPSKPGVGSSSFKSKYLNNELTQFPWPPPDPSSRYLLPNSFSACLITVGGVTNRIIEALDQRGYTERSFYSAENGGIILVTRLEQINDDGKPVLGNTRWRSGYTQRTRFKNGLVDFLAGLFYAEPGYYRIILFVIGGEPFQTTKRRANEQEAQDWLTRGMSNLPKSVQRRPFDPKKDDCTALVYEFVSEDKEREAKLLAPGKLSAQSHLEASGLLAALLKHN
jgi:hypothetical protein